MIITLRRSSFGPPCAKLAAQVAETMLVGGRLARGQEPELPAPMEADVATVLSRELRNLSRAQCPEQGTVLVFCVFEGFEGRYCGGFTVQLSGMGLVTGG